jgi:hypothetical protein
MKKVSYKHFQAELRVYKAEVEMRFKKLECIRKRIMNNKYGLIKGASFSRNLRGLGEKTDRNVEFDHLIIRNLKSDLSKIFSRCKGVHKSELKDLPSMCVLKTGTSLNMTDK